MWSLSLREWVVSQCKTHLVTGGIVQHVEKIMFKWLPWLTHFDHDRRNPCGFVYKIIQVVLISGCYQHRCRQGKLSAFSRIAILVLIFPALLRIIPGWIRLWKSLVKSIPMKHQGFIKAFAGTCHKYEATGDDFIFIHSPGADLFWLNTDIVLSMRCKAAHQQRNKKRFHVTGLWWRCYAAVQG